MNWTNLWRELFGRTEFFGIDMGFWVAMAAILLLVLLLNVLFWGMKPKHRPPRGENRPEQ